MSGHNSSWIGARRTLSPSSSTCSRTALLAALGSTEFSGNAKDFGQNKESKRLIPSVKVCSGVRRLTTR